PLDGSDVSRFGEQPVDAEIIEDAYPIGCTDAGLHVQRQERLPVGPGEVSWRPARSPDADSAAATGAQCGDNRWGKGLQGGPGPGEQGGPPGAGGEQRPDPRVAGSPPHRLERPV